MLHEFSLAAAALLKRIRYPLSILASVLVSQQCIAAEWSKNIGSLINASPILRDIDQDGDKEILISSVAGFAQPGLVTYSTTTATI